MLLGGTMVDSTIEGILVLPGLLQPIKPLAKSGYQAYRHACDIGRENAKILHIGPK